MRTGPRHLKQRQPSSSCRSASTTRTCQARAPLLATKRGPVAAGCACLIAAQTAGGWFVSQSLRPQAGWFISQWVWVQKGKKARCSNLFKFSHVLSHCRHGAEGYKDVSISASTLAAPCGPCFFLARVDAQTRSGLTLAIRCAATGFVGVLPCATPRCLLFGLVRTFSSSRSCGVPGVRPTNAVPCCRRYGDAIAGQRQQQCAVVRVRRGTEHGGGGAHVVVHAHG